MNVLVLFSYGSLTSVDGVAGFYDKLYHGTANEGHIAAGIKHYESTGMADPLGANTARIGEALVKRLTAERGGDWRLFIANKNTSPTIETVATECIQLNPKRIVTFGLTPFDTLTGIVAYGRTFEKQIRAKNETVELIHAGTFSEKEDFIEAICNRVEVAHGWLPENVRSEAEIVFTMHSMPGVAKAHEKMIGQYEALAKRIAENVNISNYHLAYRSGQPAPQRWLGPDVLDVVTTLSERNVKAIIFVEVLSVVENLEVIGEITREAIEKARGLGMQSVQSEYLNDSADFVDALTAHILEEI